MRLRSDDGHGDNQILLTDVLTATVVDDIAGLATRLEMLESRIESIERHLDASPVEPALTAEVADVLDSRVATAKRSAELLLVTLELRAELARLAAKVGEEQAPLDTRRALDLTEAVERLGGPRG